MNTVNLEKALNEPFSRVPRYTLPEAARYLSMSKSVLETWVRGRRHPSGKFSHPVINRANTSAELSFLDLVEAFVVKGLRGAGCSLESIRFTTDYWCKQWSKDRPLLDPRLRTLGSAIFRAGDNSLTDASAGGQEAFHFLEPYLERISFDGAMPDRIYPFTRGDRSKGPRIVAISPDVAHGQPVIDKKGVRTSIVAMRFLGGESQRGLAGDFGLTLNEVEEAIRYEQTARPVAA